jgi:hypothetical protein
LEKIAESYTESLKARRRWTELTANDVFIKHLVPLNFCWEYPIFASISKMYFPKHFRTCMLFERGSTAVRI